MWHVSSVALLSYPRNDTNLKRPVSFPIILKIYCTSVTKTVLYPSIEMYPAQEQNAPNESPPGCFSPLFLRYPYALARTLPPRVFNRDSSDSLSSPGWWCVTPAPAPAPMSTPSPPASAKLIGPPFLVWPPLLPPAPAMPWPEAKETEGPSMPVWSSISICRPSSSI